MPNYRNHVHSPSGRLIAAIEDLPSPGTEIQRVWSESGTLVLEAYVQDGEYHGTYRSWWDCGTPKEQGEFSHGQKVGTYRWFNQDGSLLQEHEFPRP